MRRTILRGYYGATAGDSSMYVVSKAHIDQLDIVQKDRWSHGPIEFVFLPSQEEPSTEVLWHAYRWNTWFRACTARPGDSLDVLAGIWPSISKDGNPNKFIVPSIGEYTELHAMLASVVPASELARFGIKEKRKANFWLLPLGFDEDTPSPAAYARGSTRAFTRYLWPRLVRRSGVRMPDFSPRSSLRILADDSRYWMNRLYRVAIARAEGFEEAEQLDDDWQPLEALEKRAHAEMPHVDWSLFEFRRPLRGGYTWWPDDQEECDAVIDEMISGHAVMDSIAPIVDTLLSHGTHDDFSDTYSWIKDRFERSFYHRRAKLKVSLVETTDDAPCWNADATPDGYNAVLFRDLLAMLDLKERHLVIGLRHGESVSGLARAQGLRSHASLSRRLNVLRARLRKALQ